MRQLRWLTLGWPGLPQLWFAGSWSGLAIATGFTALLNLGLLSSWLWAELFSPQIRTVIWLTVGMFWLAAAVASARWIAGLSMSGPSADDEGLFNLARSEYLRGNWFEAEVTLDRLLTRNVLDVEARLMLAMLLRHTRRDAEASQHLARLSRMDGAERWQLEISREQARLAERGRERSADNSADDHSQEVKGLAEAA
jgi:hypothetical protein